ncbi:N-acetyltransferase 8-like 2 [Cololabis saira]|uniref:N-acetyltransferase 8-like 2 n=1 Tax=Cololabis saira TaxID=129043 RepID=UPI002AD4B6C4|nr:N-acetyltransferase 8-like 2 [Cololabis saira]XP_061584408.1 N-acetyltransferase 8-like 2 [Cololabis saira]XP_061584409.1 N-acetyltransferase 8-like 2 [Cololabis saira]XP_061584410.1 N-acetyltransferase 8-like 2 [Cololabis saira]
MHLVIRRYRPSDKDTVVSLFSTGIQEHIHPSFQNAMTSPLYISITLALLGAGYLFSSVSVAVLFPAAWMGLVYYCCHELYAGYVRETLRTDMQDIVGNYLSRPDDCFWVAEAEFEGRVQVLGMVAVMGQTSGGEKQGAMFRMIISPRCRRMGLGYRMTQTVIDFCKERGFSKVVLDTSSTQTSAVALYAKLGFRHVLSHNATHVPSWLVRLTKVTILKMEKHL